MTKKLKFVFLFIAALSLFILFITKLSDYDTGFHLATGRSILTSFSIPQVDSFSHTAYGAPWHLISWFFGVFLYSCYTLIGFGGLSVLWSAFLLLLGFTIALRSKEDKDFFLPLVLTIPILIAINHRWFVRPEVMGYIFFSIFLYLVQKKDLSDKRLFSYIFINQILWTNFHLSSMNAFFVMGALGIGAILKKDSERIKKLVLVLGVLLAASIVNPYGLGHLAHSIKLFFASHIDTSLVREMMPLGKETLFSFSGILLVLSISGLIFLLVTKRYGLAIAGIVFFFLSIKSVRFLNFYFVFIAPFFIDAMIIAIKRHTILACALSIISFLGIQNVSGKGMGIDIFNIPVNASEFVLKNGIEKTGNMYNTLNFGGYLDWRFPEKSVYIDGRLDLFISTEIYREYLEIVNSSTLWKEVLEKRNITYSMVRYPHPKEDGGLYNYTGHLFPREKWALVYFDETAIVYVRRDASKTQEFLDFIKEHEYHYINPQRLDPFYMEGPEFREELERNIIESPENYRAHFYMAYIYNRLGPDFYQKAKDELLESVRINKSFKQAKEILKTLPLN